SDSTPLTQIQEPLEPQTHELPEITEEEVLATSLGFNADLVDPVPEASADTSEYLWTEKSYTVKSGDNLSIIFKRAGLSDRDLYELTGNNAEAKKLTRIMPGHELIFTLDEDNKLQRLSHIITRLKSTHFVRENEAFVTRAEARQPDIETAYKEATINSSLFLAGQAVGMHDGLIMELANIFGWDVDFALDIRKGDSFSVLFEEKFLDGEKIGTGAILAAQFTNQGRQYRAVRYTDSNNESHYYTPEGESMRKAFLQAPLDFRRISSNFNPRRLHPIYKTVRPHRGTDYAANRGTPVWASGDGRVINSGYTNANGNYIVIQHGNNIQTKYLHLHKRHVKAGERVRQRQVIGTVGSTGYSTAPHLHYEFLVDGVHRNPRTIVQKLPKASSIAQTELTRFQEHPQPIVAKLEQQFQSHRLALNESERSIN
ncbi:MAG TPA: peptidoglycan DD-metalloendopeptidase family protein, partial [Cellvibrionaceae bacterium]